jgi:hypothetical protein
MGSVRGSNKSLFCLWVKPRQGFFRQTLKGESVDDAGPVPVVLAILLAQEILKQRRNAGKRERIKAQIP